MTRTPTLTAPFVVAASVLVAVALVAAAAEVEAQAWNDNGSGIAIAGYDVVAYFTEHRAVRGSSEHAATHEGATFHFASEENRAAFAASVSRYLPAYGGYCAYAAADGRVVHTDPTAWSIANGRLYLNYSREIRETWLADRDRFIRDADARWPGIRPR